MVDARREGHLRGLERVVRGKVDGEEEDATLPTKQTNKLKPTNQNQLKVSNVNFVSLVR
jgi:hypothetical protein